MNLFDIEKRTVEELLQGFYYQDKKGYICLCCDYVCTDLGAIKTHCGQHHKQDDETAFLNLVNMDSILDMSYIEKSVYHAFYLEKTDKEIEEELGINGNTIRSYRRLLQKELCRCKVMLMLCERLKLSKRPYKKKVEADERIPGMDVNGNVIGFYTKERVHSVADPIYHASTLLLVVKRDLQGQMRFLTCTKSSKMITMTGTVGRFNKKWIDIEGGQCQENDSDLIEIGKPLPDNIFLNCAMRELEEEIAIKNYKIDPKRLQFLYWDKSNKPMYPNGHNTEITGVFITRIPDDIPKANILVRDEWADSIGEVVKKKYPSELMTWDELEAIADSDEKDVALMDGLGRIVDHIKRDSELKKKMFEMLENAEM